MASPSVGPGTRDGSGAGDRDRPCVFGLRPIVDAPGPFTEFQLARLLVMRGRVLDGAYADDRFPRYSLATPWHLVWLGVDENLLDRPHDPN